MNLCAFCSVLFVLRPEDLVSLLQYSRVALFVMVDACSAYVFSENAKFGDVLGAFGNFQGSERAERVRVHLQS